MKSFTGACSGNEGHGKFSSYEGESPRQSYTALFPSPSPRGASWPEDDRRAAPLVDERDTELGRKKSPRFATVFRWGGAARQGAMVESRIGLLWSTAAHPLLAPRR